MRTIGNVVAVLALALAAACGGGRDDEQSAPKGPPATRAKAPEVVRGILTLADGKPQLRVCGGSKALGVARNEETQVVAGILYAKMAYGGRQAAQAMYIEATGMVDGDSARLADVTRQLEVPHGTEPAAAAAGCAHGPPGTAAPGVPAIRGVFVHRQAGRGDFRACGTKDVIDADVMEAAELPTGAAMYIEGDGEIYESMVLGEQTTVRRARVRRITRMDPKQPADC